MQVDEAMHEGILAVSREQRREIKIVYSVGSIYVEYHDGTEWVTADFIDDIPATSELTYGVNIRDSFPLSWRIRNATVQQNTGQWVLREIDFCADPDCNQPLADGTAIDSGDSPAWALPAYAFDNDTSTFWKTFDTDVTGQSWLGMDYDTLTPRARPVSQDRQRRVLGGLHLRRVLRPRGAGVGHGADHRLDPRE